jgi:hypothetical protein
MMVIVMFDGLLGSFLVGVADVAALSREWLLRGTPGTSLVNDECGLVEAQAARARAHG